MKCDLRILVLLLFVSSQHTTTANIKEYHLISTKATWHNALSYCNERGWRLAAIHSQPENDLILNLIRNLGITNNFWIAGIKTGTDVGKKSMFYWSGHDEPMTFTNWHYGEPNNADNNNEYCVNLKNWNDNGPNLWADDRCDSSFYFVCEEKISSPNSNPVAHTSNGLTTRRPISYSNNKVTTARPISHTTKAWTTRRPVSYSSSALTTRRPISYSSNALTTPTGINQKTESKLPQQNQPVFTYSQPTVSVSSQQTSTVNIKEYHLISTKATWHNALSYCNEHGWRLAAIHSQPENDLILNLIRNLGIRQNFWTAGIKTGTDVGGSSTFFWSGHDEPMTFTNWHYGEPNNADNNNEYCVSLKSWNDNEPNVWADDRCDSSFNFVCEEKISIPNSNPVEYTSDELTTPSPSPITYSSIALTTPSPSPITYSTSVLTTRRPISHTTKAWTTRRPISYTSNALTTRRPISYTTKAWTTRRPVSYSSSALTTPTLILYSSNALTTPSPSLITYTSNALTTPGPSPSLISYSSNTLTTTTGIKQMTESKLPEHNQPVFTYSQPTISGGDCVIERTPKNGWIEDAQGSILVVGKTVSQFSFIYSKCSANRLIDGSTTILCHQGKLSNPILDCQPRCSPRMISGLTISATSCLLNGVEVQCSDSAKPGTQAFIYCRDRYERLSASKLQVAVCGVDGLWTPIPEACTPICGEETNAGLPYVAGGFQASINEVPWHAVLYKFNGIDYQLQCGGTIISERIIVSAMHCFWDPQEARPFEPSLFRVATGKEKLGYDAIENQKDQKFEVEKFLNAPGYNHATSNYVADIVLIVLKTSIEFRSYIAPICIPYGLRFDEISVPAGWTGRVAGFGKTASIGSPSKYLKKIELPVIDKAQCLAESDKEFRPNITPDKFCAGYLNANVGVCQGDSGGGLVFNQTVNDRIKWYLRGIVSVGVNNMGSCDTNKYTTFTNVASYDNLLETYEPMYRPPR